MLEAISSSPQPLLPSSGDPISGVRGLVVGVEREASLFGGARRPYINFDNAATTPPFRAVLDSVNRFMEVYSSIHRGTGYKSVLSTEVYEQCRAAIAAFAGADPARHATLFCCNTTHAIHKLCARLRLAPGEIVLTTLMEHHSNLLPWRLAGAAEVAMIRGAEGSLDLEDLERKLREHGGRVRLVTVTGASNVTGAMPPLRAIARLAHAHGARLMVDAAQLIAHRPIDMGRSGDPESIDFLAFSAHKIYAPFGLGVLIGPREVFEDGPPSVAGGGTVKIVTMDEIVWADPPELEEAGTPNVTGAIALAKSLQVLGGLGMTRVAEHERGLTAHLLRRLAAIPGIRVYGDADPALDPDRVAVVPILAEGYDHALLAAILGYEYGIGVRHGCFCANPYTLRLLGVGPEDVRAYTDRVRRGDRRGLPGFVRISLGIYNTLEEIDTLADALATIMAAGPRARYRQTPAGQVLPEDFTYDFERDFTL